MSPVKTLSPADCVQKRPEMYWNGNPSPGYEDVNAAIADQLRDDGCQEISISSKEGWHLIFCELSWAKMVCEKFGSIERIFDDAVVVSGPNAGGLRVEWLVAVLALAVRVWVDGQVVYSKSTTKKAFDKLLPSELRGRVCLAYRLADSEARDEAQDNQI